MTVTIANAQAFWGDRPCAAKQLLAQSPQLDYITMDYLAEVSLSILAAQQKKDPEKGYAADFLEVIDSLLPFYQKGGKTKIIANAGGLNPEGLAKKIREKLTKNHLTQHVEMVTGDDVTQIIAKDSENPLFSHMETGQKLPKDFSFTTANAYLGADQILSALEKRADIVVTGRVADPSMVVAAAQHAFYWPKDDYNKIAAATVAGHLLECGTQVTGGCSTDWLLIEHPEKIGYPIVELEEDGTFVITKPEKAGGIVTKQTVTEQLLYEIGDPKKYISPDCIVDFTTVNLETVGPNRIRVSGVKGFAPTNTYKVSATYFHGYKAESYLTIVGEKAAEKGQKCGEMIFQRCKEQGLLPKKTRIEVLGAGCALKGVLQESIEATEVVLRVAAFDPQKEPLKAFSKEIAPLVTSGPQGVTGYTSGRPKIRPVYAFWPCLIEKDQLIKHCLEKV